MSDRFQTDPIDAPANFSFVYPGLPAFLSRRLLRPDEKITWVRGPRWQPDYECYLTHPAWFLLALAVVAVSLVAGWFLSPGGVMPAWPLIVAGVAFFGSIYVLAFFSGYFTRLVVTDSRVLIVQGYEVRRSWSVANLPRSLVRMDKRDDGEVSRTVDLDTLQTMLGGSSDGFVEAKTIWTLGKQLDQIKEREKGRP
jgi:hypothetical protein